MISSLQCDFRNVIRRRSNRWMALEVVAPRSGSRVARDVLRQHSSSTQLSGPFGSCDERKVLLASDQGTAVLMECPDTQRAWTRRENLRRIAAKYRSEL